MTKILHLCLTIALFLLSTHVNCAPPPGNWEVTFEDNFDNPALGSEKWNYLTGPRRSGYWDKDGVQANGDGVLKIITAQRSGRIISGAIDTKGRFEQRFGYFEARCKLPSSPGHWSAFWLLSRQFGNSKSADITGSEIDIFEYHTLLGDNIHHAVHWPNYGPDMQSKKKKTAIINDGRFHIYGLLWEPDRYVFFIDDKAVWTLSEGISRAAHYIILSNEVGAWAGSINPRKLPDEMICDYIRAYRKAT